MTSISKKDCKSFALAAQVSAASSVSLTDGCSWPQVFVNIKERVSDFVDGGLAFEVSETEGQAFSSEGIGPSTQPSIFSGISETTNGGSLIRGCSGSPYKGSPISCCLLITC